MKDKMNYWFKIISISVIAFVSIIMIASKPTIILKNQKEIILDVGNNYSEPGYIASFVLKNETKKVKIKNNVDNEKLGEYEVKYSLDIDGEKVEKVRKVKVIDTKKPKIELLGNSYACNGSQYKEEGYKAIDNYDGDITNRVEKKVDGNKIIYKVEDSSHNSTKITREISYGDIEGPTISFISDEVINVYLGEEYNEPGYNAYDNCEGDVTDKMTVSGSVDTNNLGKYTITYNAIDSKGNKTEKKRIVNVIDKDTAPSIDGRDKTIYLTFDDGPSSTTTPALLDILKEENVKATFFVINHSDDLNYLIKREYDEGHVVAIHSYTHDYSYVYSSEAAYFEDLEAMRNKVYNIIGVKSNLIRFPGGSSNTVSRKYTPGIMTNLTKKVLDKGYIYFDWNVSSEDAGEAVDEKDVYNRIVRNLVYKDNVVLMHDFENNDKTLNAIRDIIKFGKENGYTFKTISEKTYPARHGVNN